MRHSMASLFMPPDPPRRTAADGKERSPGLCLFVSARLDCGRMKRKGRSSGTTRQAF